MYFASIIDTNFERIKEIAISYKNIELRLARLNLSDNELLQIINITEHIILTDIPDISINYTLQTFTSEKIIIDCPIEKLKHKKLRTFVQNPTCRKLLSIHCFEKNTHIKELPKIIEKQLLSENINIAAFEFIKIAVQCYSYDDVTKLFSLFNWRSNLILIPMGKEWTEYRRKSLKLGSKFMFGFVDKPTADGQENINIERYYN